MSEQVCVIVLAAGLSQRMEYPKPLLRLGETTFIERILSNTFLSRGGVETCVVLGHDKDKILSVGLPDSVRIVENPNYRSGRTTSVQAGLRALPQETSATFIWPVDCPLVPPDVLQSLLSALEDDSTICIPSYERRRGHPPLIGASYFTEILRMGENEPLRDLYRKHPHAIRHVNVDTETVLHNVNTPEEYQAIKEFYLRSEKE